MALSLLMLNDIRRAEEWVARAEQATRQWPRPQADAQFARALVQVQQGRLTEASELLQGILMLKGQLGSLEYEACGLLLEVLHLQKQDPNASRDILGQLARSTHDPRLTPLVEPAASVATHVLGGCDGSCLKTVDLLIHWERRDANTIAAIGLVKLGPLAFSHRGRAAVPTVLGWLERAERYGLLPFLKWWLRDYGPFAPLLAASNRGTAVLLRFLEADPEFWRAPVASILARANGARRELRLGGLVRFANKATVAALADIPGSDVEAARRHLTRAQAPRIFIRAFGTLSVHKGSWDGPARTIDKRRLRVLLGLLVAHSGRALSRDVALDVLWPEAMPASAVNNLNQSVYQLRRALDEQYRDGDSPNYVVSTSEFVQLDPDLVRIDVDEFRLLSTRLALNPGPTEHGRLGHALVDLARGAFLEDLRYEEWVQPVSDAVHAEVREVLLPLASSSSTSPDLAVRAGCALMAIDEFDETAAVVTARQMAQAGRRSAARDLILRFARRLEEELDETPSTSVVETLTDLGAAVPRTSST
jgi:DNA-binding SARP family transcriptional activator